MILGQVGDLEAIIELEIVGLDGRATTVAAVIDTGYTGELSLSGEVIQAIGLTSLGQRSGKLADGSVIQLNIFAAKVVWHGALRDVTVLQTDGGALVGMCLLEGQRISMDVIRGGEVRIEPRIGSA